jgi:hypothetical protein
MSREEEKGRKKMIRFHLQSQLINEDQRRTLNSLTGPTQVAVSRLVDDDHQVDTDALWCHSAFLEKG